MQRVIDKGISCNFCFECLDLRFSTRFEELVLTEDNQQRWIEHASMSQATCWALGTQRQTKPQISRPVDCNKLTSYREFISVSFPPKTRKIVVSNSINYP